MPGPKWSLMLSSFSIFARLTLLALHEMVILRPSWTGKLTLMVTGDNFFLAINTRAWVYPYNIHIFCSYIKRAKGMLQIFQHNNHIKAMENTKFPPKNICSNCKKFFRFGHCMIPEVGWDKGILHSPSKPGDSRDSFWEGLVNYIFKHFLLGGQGRFGTKPNFFLKIFKLIPYTFNMLKIFYHTARERMKRR